MKNNDDRMYKTKILIFVIRFKTYKNNDDQMYNLRFRF